ncbi:MAG: Do family serine endopeptidase [Caulobacter sp.]|nr:Do family serine endopeptidase [Caulobacter sp.]
MRPYKVLLPALVVLAACSPGAGTQAQGLPEPTKAPPSSAAAMRTSFAPVVKKAAPAVVNVSSKRTVRQRVDPFWDFFSGGGVPRERVQQSLGSGSIVRADGVILTNNHNIEGADEVMVQLADRREFPAKVLLADARADLAVLKIDVGNEKLPVIAIDDHEKLEVGDLVLAIGNPFGVGQTVTNGIVSATARSNVGITDFSFFIQTDAAINPGNSGGPLVDMDGDLVGVNTAILSRSGQSSGVGFAIPAQMARQVVSAALGGENAVVRPWLGARTQAITADIARSLGQSAPRGVLVADVWPNAAAAKAGLKQGDVILSVDGEAVNDESGVSYYFGNHRNGQTVVLKVLRDGREMTLNVHAEKAPGRSDGGRLVDGRNPLQGAFVAELTPAMADAQGIDPFLGRGVVVLKVAPDGLAARVGLRPGDFIRAINGKAVRTEDDLARATVQNSRRWSVTIERGGQEITSSFVL